LVYNPYMEVYKVGGCIRDKYLNLSSKDQDWVVVGATPDELKQLGYQPVGKDFPVFLHPESKEEYALARTERKTAPGYTGFEFYAAADVTLEDDLKRRDLTINAMAEDANGTLIDPYNGKADLDNRILRHISPAFAEDPVRILRVARFAARFAELGFTVADETNELMQQMVDNGEVDALVPERVWQETVNALSKKTPARFFEVLRDCGALKKIFPEVERLYGVPQPEEYHPEIDTGVHTMMVLTQAARLSDDPAIRFAALVHDLGKGITPENEWPKHIAHEESGVPLVEALCDRLKVPNQFRELAIIVTRYHLHYHRAVEMRDDTFLETLEKLDAFRRPERFEQFLVACEADSRGRTGYEDTEFDQPKIFREAFAAAAKIDAKPFIEQGLQGTAIADAIKQARIEVIKQARQPYLA